MKDSIKGFLCGTEDADTIAAVSELPRLEYPHLLLPLEVLYDSLPVEAGDVMRLGQVGVRIKPL